MDFSDEDFLTEIPKTNTRAIARLLSLVENGSPRARPLVKKLFSRTGQAHIIGITGSPGAGKSTLVDGLAVELTKSGKKVAILAIDPSSPFSGGAILGDRIRMNKIAEYGAVFIRSMATRGALGGLARATVDAIQVLDAAGFDVLIIETVGVGQAEVDIVRIADSCVVVVVPGMGDSVQAIKAGILEIADIFTVNKSDRDGADHLVKDLRVILSLAEYMPTDWEPKIVSTIATTLQGIPELFTALAEHKQWLVNSVAGKERKKRVLKDMIMTLTGEIGATRSARIPLAELEAIVDQCFSKQIDPYSAAETIFERFARI
jgi:LAO/AO transport system kinase